MSTSKLRRVLADFLLSSKQSYLSSTRSATKSSTKEWTVVMGNESGDLDTIACAIAYAYHQTHHFQKPTIPLIRIHRDDLRLRKENTYALALAGIDEPEVQLLLLSDLPAQDKWFQHDFALVDHNRLSPEFYSASGEGKEPRVVAVIDHHADEGLHTDTAKPRLISPTGSCASQIAAYILESSSNTDISVSIPPDLSTLLLCAILIDTNIKPIYDGGKATELDIHAAGVLASHAKFPEEVSKSDVESMRDGLSKVNLPPSSLLQFSTSQSPQPSENLESIRQYLRASSSIRTLSETLLAKKFDVSHLNVSELLKRDYKQYDHTVALPGNDNTQIKVGLSTVPVRLSDFAASGSEGDIDLLLRHGETYMKEHGLSVLGVLTSFRKVKKKSGRGKAAREMVWLIRSDTDSSSSSLAERIFKGMEVNEELSIKAHKKFRKYTKPSSSKSGSDGSNVHARHNDLIVKVYKQGNANATRKVTAPILRQILEGSEYDNTKL